MEFSGARADYEHLAVLVLLQSPGLGDCSMS